MKKLIFSAFIATVLCLSSCGKDDDNGGGSTSLTGDWYIYMLYNMDENIGKYNWRSPNQCAEQTRFEISDKVFKHKRVYEEGGTCKEDFVYYDYTTSNGVFNLTVRADSPADRKGKTVTVDYKMKNKELIITSKTSKGYYETRMLHKKGVDYSYLDPFVGYWRMTKATVGQTEAIVQDGKCLSGTVIASSIGFTLYLNVPEQSGQCQKTINTYEWVKEGNKYYNVTDPQNKVELPLVFSENNTKLSYSEQTQNGLVTLYFTKVK